MFNKAAPEGKEDVLVKIAVDYRESLTDSLLELDEYDFGTLSNGNILDDYVTVVVPEPVFKPKLFPGGSPEGYIVKLVFDGDPNPLLYVGDPGDLAFYFSLSQEFESNSSHM